MEFFQCAFIVMVSQARGILSMPFHCHGFAGQWGSFNVFSLSWLRRAVGFFQCLFIVMVSQGKMGFWRQWDSLFQCLFIVMVSQGNGILRATGFFIWMSFHCHGFTGHLDSFNVLSLIVIMNYCYRFQSIVAASFQCYSLVVDIELAVNLAIELAVNLQNSRASEMTWVAGFHIQCHQSLNETCSMPSMSCHARLPGCRRRLGICRKRGLSDRPLGHRPYTRARKKSSPT